MDNGMVIPRHNGVVEYKNDYITETENYDYARRYNYYGKYGIAFYKKTCSKLKSFATIFISKEKYDKIDMR